MQFAAQPKPPVGVVFDSDMGNRIESALALALLYGFDGKNEVRAIALSVSKSNLNSAAYCDAVGRFYAGPVSAAFGASARTLPVGMATGGKRAEDTPMLTGPLSKLKADGAPMYPHSVHKLNDTADPVAVIRNAFTGQYDQNAIVVIAGPATNLAKVLDLPGAKDLIARKVRYLAITAGAYAGNGAAVDAAVDVNVQIDIAAARKIFEEWPTPVVANGQEIGDTVMYPASSIETDFAWSPEHPVAEAYRSAGTMPYDAPTRDMAAVLYAARPKEGYFKLSDAGTVTVLDDGRTRFAPSPEGKHRYLIFDPAQKDRILKTYTELASAKPVPRQPRQRRPQNQDVKPEAKAPEK